MSLWVVFSLAAAFLQTVRFMLQKRLADATLSAGGATFARFLYSAPIAVLGVALAGGLGPMRPSGLGTYFWGLAASGGAAQVIATICIVRLFRARNFAVGIAFAKTEVILTVLVGLALVGEGVQAVEFGFIALGAFGVILLSVPPGVSRFRLRNALNAASLLGLTAGLLFAVSAVAYRAASLEIASEAPLLRAGLTLAAVTTLQTVGMALWLGRRQPGEIGRVARAWPRAGLVGLFSLAGSFCWFTAFTLQSAALVKAVGQVELVFGLLAAVLVFREKVTPREVAGAGLLGCSILGILVAA